ncbi:MAG: succinate dehydrogenase assembly factor 2 [Gammaproteobacteria bacterium]|nr:succinate dehydrogenase assembly factor 2 [Gammaproteobacteria bacterium]
MLARLRWRCRRGTRELDALMLGWLDQHYPAATPERRQAFIDLLDMQDPDLMKLIISDEAPADDQAQHADSHSPNARVVVLTQIRSGNRP